MDDFNFEDFEQYLVQGEPDKKKKTYARDIEEIQKDIC